MCVLGTGKKQKAAMSVLVHSIKTEIVIPIVLKALQRLQGRTMLE